MQSVANRSRTLVKVCGVRSADEARRILDLGADAVGVVVANGSPRQVSTDEAFGIAATRPHGTVLVGRGDEADWADLTRSWPGPVQIHGPGLELRRPFIRALAAGARPDANERVPVACLLDAPAAGSGALWDWSTAASPWPSLPLILAGGLTPANVHDALTAVRPWAVDVSSGVERERGRKDLELVRAFLQAVRACDEASGRTDEASPAGFEALR
jgi:phosphoribosylanthranilate isomerase